MKHEASTATWPTPAEVAEMFNCTERTIRRWIDKGHLEAVRLGPRLIRVNPASLAGKPVTPEGDK